MTILYSTTFDSVSDANLNAYGDPDWYIVRVVSVNDIQVIGARDRVEFTIDGQVDFGCGLIHTKISSINNYSATALVRRRTGRDMGMLGVRCGGIASSNFYMIGSDSNDDLVLYRGNGGSATAINTTSASIPENAELTVTVSVSGTNPVVLTYSIGAFSDTYSDSDAGRHQSGPPGVFFANLSGPQIDIWLDDFRVSDDLSGADFAVGSRHAGRSRWKLPDKWEVEWDGVVKTFKSPLDAEAWLDEQVSKRNRERALAMAREKARIAARIKLDEPSDYKPLVNIFWTPED